MPAMPRERANVVDAIKRQASKAEERGFDIDAVTANDRASWASIRHRIECKVPIEVLTVDRRLFFLAGMFYVTPFRHQHRPALPPADWDPPTAPPVRPHSPPDLLVPLSSRAWRAPPACSAVKRPHRAPKSAGFRLAIIPVIGSMNLPNRHRATGGRRRRERQKSCARPTLLFHAPAK